MKSFFTTNGLGMSCCGFKVSDFVLLQDNILVFCLKLVSGNLDASPDSIGAL